MAVKNPGQLEVLTSVGDLDLYNDLSLIWDKSAAKLKGILPSNLPVPDQDGVFYASRYGATGDGVTDDTSAIASLRAAAYAYASGGLLASVIFDPGIYKVTDASLFEIFDDLTIVGYGATIYFPSGGTVRDTTAVQTYLYDNGLFYSSSSDIDTFSMYGLEFNIDDSRVCPLQIGTVDTLNGSITGNRIVVEDCVWDGGAPSVVIGVNDFRWLNNSTVNSSWSLFLYNSTLVSTTDAGELDLISFGADRTGTLASGPAIQCAINIASTSQTTVFCPAGNYKLGTGDQLLIKNDVTMYGPSYGAGASFISYYSGSGYPVDLDGANGDGGVWLFNVTLQNLYFDASNWSGSATHFMRITGVYSTTLRDVTVDACPTSKKTMLIGKLNHLVLDRVRLVRSTGEVVVAFDVDSTTGEINGLTLRSCDPERATTGVKFTGSTYRITAEIIDHYAEESDIFIDWNSSNVESCLTIVGGTILGRNLSTGVKIRQSNCSVLGLAFNNSGTYSVDIDSASSSANCHVIGGNLRSAVRDTSRVLATNTYGTLKGSATYDPGTVSDTFGASTSFTVSGAALGDHVQIAFSKDLVGVLMNAWVSSSNTVSVRFQNETGSSWTPGSGTLYARVHK